MREGDRRGRPGQRRASVAGGLPAHDCSSSRIPQVGQQWKQRNKILFVTWKLQLSQFKHSYGVCLQHFPHKDIKKKAVGTVIKTDQQNCEGSQQVNQEFITLTFCIITYLNLFYILAATGSSSLSVKSTQVSFQALAFINSKVHLSTVRRYISIRV